MVPPERMASSRLRHVNGGALHEAEGLILAAGLISLGLVVLRDKWKLVSRLVSMRRSFLEVLGLREDVRKRLLDDQRL